MRVTKLTARVVVKLRGLDDAPTEVLFTPAEYKLLRTHARRKGLGHSTLVRKIAEGAASPIGILEASTQANMADGQWLRTVVLAALRANPLVDQMVRARDRYEAQASV